MLSNIDRTLRPLGSSQALLLPVMSACFWFSYESASKNNSDHTVNAQPKQQAELKVMIVRVEGATATREGDTFEIGCPVLKASKHLALRPMPNLRALV